MGDDEWTSVPRKKKGKTFKMTAMDHEPEHIKGATVESITKEFETKSKIWKRSEARIQLRRILTLLRPDAGWQLETAVCLGTGSFNRDNFECRKRSMEQFAMFADTLEYLQELQERKITGFVQEGYYNDLDKKFLATLGMQAPEYEPHAVFPIRDCGPATKLFGPHTFVCELFIEHSVGTVKSLTQTGGPLLMTTSRLMCSRDFYAGESFNKGDQARLLSAMNKIYRTMRFPHFDEDPNTFDGLDILALEPQDEEELVVKSTKSAI